MDAMSQDSDRDRVPPPGQAAKLEKTLNIYLARHGQNQDNANGILNGHRDLPLTDLGVSQAKQLANGIVRLNLKFDATYSSPLCQAYDTAAIVTDALDIPKPEVIAELIERDFGIMAGKSQKDIETICGSERVLKTD